MTEHTPLTERVARAIGLARLKHYRPELDPDKPFRRQVWNAGMSEMTSGTALEEFTGEDEMRAAIEVIAELVGDLLVDAAPELLEALEAILAKMYAAPVGCHPDDMDTQLDFQQHIEDVCRAAIAKATGE